MLLDFAVVQGRALADVLIQRVKKAQNYLAEGAEWPSDAERAEFEAAYRDLAQFMQPVTAETLRATTNSAARFWWQRFFGASPATWFSRRLYCLVLLCAAAIVIDHVLAPTAATPAAGAAATRGAAATANVAWAATFEALMPFLYGLLGALVYLLRSAHAYIANRTFDLYRTPEYYNRMILGFLSGGVMLLFMTKNSGSGISSANVGMNTIAFLVGYNTDYLFQTIERVANAVFPQPGTSGAKGAVPGMAKLDIPNPQVKPGTASNGSVVLTGTAQEGGVQVALTADPRIKLAASSVSVGQGSTTANFTFTVAPDAMAGSQLTITATANGTSASGSVTVA